VIEPFRHGAGEDFFRPIDVNSTPNGLTQQGLADAIHVPFQRVNEIVRGRRALEDQEPIILESHLSAKTIVTAKDWRETEGGVNSQA